MPCKITWDREMRAEAKSADNTLFAVGYECGTSTAISHTPSMSSRLAKDVFLFAIKVATGVDPAQAFKEVFETE